MTTSIDRRWQRGSERRLGLSRFLAQALESLRTSDSLDDRRSRLERDIGHLFNVPSVEIKTTTRPGRALSVREGPGVMRTPLPALHDPSMEIELRAPPRALDAWSRQSLSDIARIVSLVLSAAVEAGRAPEGGVGGRARADDDTRESHPRGPTLVGDSVGMLRLRHEVGRMARTDFTVLIEGDSGCGKELVARLIHEQSGRSDGPFIGVNCAALVETLLEAELFGIEDRTATGVRGRRGKFELASGGTLFLDEVADLSAAAQAKLLRAIQERAIERVGGHSTRDVNARIVVATNQSLRQLVEEGRFRADLFYRLSGVEIQVPPLRSRREDIPALTSHFLGRHRNVRPISLSPAALDALLSYSWPGNVRELERVIERAVALAISDEITLEDLPQKVTGDFSRVLAPSLDDDDTMRTWGSRYARIVLERCDNNKRRACRVLGISYHTLQAYLLYRGASPESDAASIAGSQCNVPGSNAGNLTTSGQR